MEDRERRVGENEALFRAVNEQVEDLQRGLAAVSTNTMDIVCECGDIACVERLVVAMPKYEEVRADGALFFIVPGHEIPAVEDVVEHGDGYDVVRKHPGGPAELAEATDPRG